MDFLKEWLKFSGRISRKTFIFRCLILYIISFLISMASGNMDPVAMAGNPAAWWPILVVLIALLWVFYAAVNRRWHDIGMGWGWTLGTFITSFVIIPWIMVLIYLVIKKGDVGENAYGPDPYDM